MRGFESFQGYKLETNKQAHTMRKLNHPGRSRMEQWLRENARVLDRIHVSENVQLTMYSVGGTLVYIVDMYNKKEDGDYQGFEVMAPIGGNSISDAIEKLEELTS